MFKIHFRRFNYSKDLELLYTYMLCEEHQMLFSHSFQSHNINMFEHWLTEKFARNEYHDFFIIENDCHKTIGFTFSYEFFALDAHCKFTLCLLDDYKNIGYGAVAALKMIDYMFKKYPLKRLFVSVFDYNNNSISNITKGGFELNGVLPEYRYHAGEYHSLHIFSLTREKFYSIHNKKVMMLS